MNFKRTGALIASVLFVFSQLANNAHAANQIISESSNHKTVKVTLGSTFTVQLHSTYWNFDSLKGKSIKAIGTTKVAPIMPGPNAPAGCQVAGMGCGTVSLKFKAINKGISTVNASRTSCGEALRCTPAQSNYYVTIKVN